MKIIELDLTDCKYLGEIHQRIKEAFDFPDYYGKNWSAFWDCINVDNNNDLVKISGSKKVAKELTPHIEMMIKLLEENKQYWAKSIRPFDYEVLD